MKPFFASLGRFLILLLFSNYLNAQIKISDLGTGTPHPSAILELESSQKNKVFLLPRLSETERRNIPYKVNGLMVYDNTFNDIYIYHENEWYPAAVNPIILSNEFGLIDENDNMVFSGDSTLTKATTGKANMGFGFESLKNTLTGESNLGIGVRSLTNNLHGSDNIAIGHESQKNNLSGNKNISVGYESLFNNRTGNNNIALGNFAIQGSGNDIGNDNIGIGVNSLFHNQLGSYNIGYGVNSLYNLGNNAGNRVDSLTKNIGIGYQALYSLVKGKSNIGVGNNSFPDLKYGKNNIAIGDSSGFGLKGYRLVSGREQIQETNNNILIGNNIGSNTREVGSNYLQIANALYGKNIHQLNNSVFGINYSSLDNQNSLSEKLIVNGKLRVRKDAGPGKLLVAIDQNGTTQWQNKFRLAPPHSVYFKRKTAESINDSVNYQFDFSKYKQEGTFSKLEVDQVNKVIKNTSGRNIYVKVYLNATMNANLNNQLGVSNFWIVREKGNNYSTSQPRKSQASKSLAGSSSVEIVYWEGLLENNDFISFWCMGGDETNSRTTNLYSLPIQTEGNSLNSSTINQIQIIEY